MTLFNISFGSIMRGCGIRYMIYVIQGIQIVEHADKITIIVSDWRSLEEMTVEVQNRCIIGI